jgi:hypothetical protein
VPRLEDWRWTIGSTIEALVQKLSLTSAQLVAIRSAMDRISEGGKPIGGRRVIKQARYLHVQLESARRDLSDTDYDALVEFTQQRLLMTR